MWLVVCHKCICVTNIFGFGFLGIYLGFPQHKTSQLLRRQKFKNKILLKQRDLRNLHEKIILKVEFCFP